MGGASEWMIVCSDVARGGGMDRCNYELAHYLAEHDARVTLVAHRVDPQLASHPNVRVHLVPRPFDKNVLGMWPLAIAGTQRARQAVARDRSTRVVVNGGNAFGSDINWVHYVHEAELRERVLLPGARRLLALHDRIAERRALLTSKVVIANSPATERDLRKLGVASEKIKRVDLTVDAREWPRVTPERRTAARISLGLPETSRVAIFVGALNRRKGLDRLLAAWSHVRLEDRSSPQLLIVGGGPRDVWELDAQARGVSGSVQFLGRRTDVPELFAACDLAINVSRYEPYGLAVHEALASGVPSLVPRQAGIADYYPRELVPLLCDDADVPTTLARHISTILSEAPKWRALALAASAQFRARSWEDMARDFMAAVGDSRFNP